MAYGSTYFYSEYDTKKNKKRLVMSIEDVIYELTKKRVYKTKRMICLNIGGEKDGIDYMMPDVRYHFGSKSIK